MLLYGQSRFALDQKKIDLMMMMMAIGDDMLVIGDEMLVIGDMLVM